MGHNVSSSKTVVSQARNSASVGGKRAENGNSGINNFSSVTEPDLDSRVETAVKCFKRSQDYDVKVKGDSRICDITGCCILPDGCLILSDFTNKRLKKVNNKKQVGFIDLPEQPSDICYLGKNDNKVAVCGGNSLHFVNIKGNMKLSRSVTVDHICNGITVHGDHLYIVDDTSVMRYTITGERKDKIYSSTKSKFCHISVSANGTKLYVSDEGTGLVTIDTSGKLLATFKDQDLKEAQGVCVDTDGNVLVGGFESDSVVKVDSSGKTKVGTVIRDNGDISDPKCLCVDNQNSKLYVGQWNDRLTVFEMK